MAYRYTSFALECFCCCDRHQKSTTPVAVPTNYDHLISSYGQAWPKWAETLRTINSFVLASAFIGIGLSADEAKGVPKWEQFNYMDVAVNVFIHALFWGAIAFFLAFLAMAVLTAVDRLTFDASDNFQEAKRYGIIEAAKAKAKDDAEAKDEVKAEAKAEAKAAEENKLLALQQGYRQKACVRGLIQWSVLLTIGSSCALGGSLCCLMVHKTGGAPLGWVAVAFIMAGALAGAVLFLIPFYFYRTRAEAD